MYLIISSTLLINSYASMYIYKHAISCCRKLLEFIIKIKYELIISLKHTFGHRDFIYICTQLNPIIMKESPLKQFSYVHIYTYVANYVY